MSDSSNSDPKNLDLPRLSVLGQDHSGLFDAESAGTTQADPSDTSTSQEAHIPFADHPGFSQVFTPGKLTFGLIAPFKGYRNTPVPNVDDLAELAQGAEDAGFSALWLRDVPFLDRGFGDVGQGYDPIVTLGYLAAKTSSIALGTAGIVTTLREPIHVAKAAATVDALTNGRMLLGLSTGDRPSEFPAFNAGFENRGERFREAWELIDTLIKNPTSPSFAGEHYGQLSGELEFIPQLDHRVPMVSIGRARQEFSWLANRADAWIWHGVNPRDTKNIVDMLARLNTNHTWHPFGYANFVDVSDDPNEPATLHNNIFLRGGTRELAKFWKEQKEQGLAHVTLNLKPTKRSMESVYDEFATNVLEVVNG